MLNNFLRAEITRLELENIWFQQDGATCHTVRGTLKLLREKSPGRVISTVLVVKHLRLESNLRNQTLLQL